MNSKSTEQMFEELCEVITSIDNTEDCKYFLKDLLSLQEIDSISGRLRAAKLLYEGKTYTDIIEQTKISSATVARVNKCIKYSEGYNRVLNKNIKK